MSLAQSAGSPDGVRATDSRRNSSYTGCAHPPHVSARLLLTPFVHWLSTY